MRQIPNPVCTGLILMALVAGACGRPAPPARPAGPTPMWTNEPVGAIVEVAPRVYLVPGGGCNTVVFVARAGVVVVDTKYAATWPATVAQIRTITDKPITHVINTHFHDDHAEGNTLLDASVQVVVPEPSATRLIEHGLVPVDATGRARAVQTFTDRTTLLEGDDAVDLYHVAPAHTDGDTVVVFRQARVVAMGDVFPDKQFPIINIEGGGSGATFEAALRQLTTVIPGVDRVVTGHGPVLRSADVAEYADFIRLVVDYVRGEMRLGRKKADVFSALKLPARFESYNTKRSFDTQDEIDRSFRPRWQRIFSIETTWRRLAVESPHAHP